MSAVDRSIRVIVPEAFAEVAGAVLMELLGPFELETSGGALVFYPPAGATPSLKDVLAVLPPELRESGLVRLEARDVTRDWVDGWKDHFRPVVIGEVRIRPPWEPALGAAPVDGAVPGAASVGAAAVSPSGAEPAGTSLVDVVINPGLGFGTGLHPTTRGTLRLLQAPPGRRGGPERFRGPLVDCGTGSGILAIAAAKLGWGPVFAFDNDPVALVSARENIVANGVERIVEVHEVDVAGASPYWFSGATVLANMTLEPVLALVRRLAPRADSWTEPGGSTELPYRLVVSGILAGAQEQELLDAAAASGFCFGERIYGTEWVSLELLPARPGAGDLPVSAGEASGVAPGGR